MRRSLIPLFSILVAATAWSNEVDLYGDMGWGWRTEFDKEWTPANYFNQSLELGTRIHLDEGVKIEAELSSYTTVLDSAGAAHRTPIYNGAGRLSSSIEPDVQLQGVRALWTIVPGATIGVGDQRYSAGNIRQSDQWREQNFYGSILSRRGVRGFLLQLSDFSGAIGVPWESNPNRAKDKSLTLYGQYNITAINNSDRSLLVVPVAEINVGNGRTRVWNFGVDLSYADAVLERPYTIEGAVGYLDVATKPVWTFLVEPSISLGMVSLGTSFYFATLNGDNTAERLAELEELDLPVQMFATFEPMVTLHRKIALGLPIAWNNPTIDQNGDEWSTAGLALHLWPTRLVSSDVAVRYNLMPGAPDYWQIDLQAFLTF